MNVLKLFSSLFLPAIVMTFGSHCVMFAQEVCRRVRLNGDDSEVYIEKIYEINYDSVHGFKKIKGRLNGYPLTAVYDNVNVGVSMTSFNASHMLKNGLIEKSDVHVPGKAFEGGNIPPGAVVILKRVSFGSFRRHNVKARVVDNCGQAFSVGKKFFVGEVVVNKNIIKVRFLERIQN